MSEGEAGSSEDIDWEDGDDGAITVRLDAGDEAAATRKRKRRRLACTERDMSLAKEVHKAHVLSLVARTSALSRACSSAAAAAQARGLIALPDEFVAQKCVSRARALSEWFRREFRAIDGPRSRRCASLAESSTDSRGTVAPARLCEVMEVCGVRHTTRHDEELEYR